jgi:hypothetical protein
MCIRYARFVTARSRHCELASCFTSEKNLVRYWEGGEDLSLLEFKAIEYKRKGNAIATEDELVRIAKSTNSCAVESINTR